MRIFIDPGGKTSKNCLGWNRVRYMNPRGSIAATGLNSGLQRLVDRELGQIAPFADIAYENVHSRK